MSGSRELSLTRGVALGLGPRTRSATKSTERLTTNMQYKYHNAII